MRRFFIFMADVLWQMIAFHLLLWAMERWLEAGRQEERSLRLLRDCERYWAWRYVNGR